SLDCYSAIQSITSYRHSAAATLSSRNVEAWRIVATALLGISGLLGILIVMAGVRERTGSSTTVAVSGLVSLTALLVCCVLTLTVFSGIVTWGLAGVTMVATGVLVITG